MSYPLRKAAKAAHYIIDLLQPHCNRISIAGSIRRLRPEVKDIEIVCDPKKVPDAADMFGGGPLLIIPGFSEALAIITGKVISGNVNGRMMRIITNSALCPGIILDLFMPVLEDYWRQLAIRTGSGDYSHHVIAGAWKRKGWVGVKEIGLRKISECDFTVDSQGKKIYKVKPDLPQITLPPVWKNEGEVFTWLGLEYIDPEFREFNKSVNELQ